MKLNKLLVTALVGTMLVGSLVANASPEPETNRFKAIASTKATMVKMLSEEEIAKLKDQRENATPGIVMQIGEIANAIEFEELSEELQAKLVERFGESAKTMFFANEEMAETLATGEGSMMSTAATLTPAKALTEEELAELEELRKEYEKQGIKIKSGTTTSTAVAKIY